MDTPENYYAVLGVPIDADDDTLKRAYRQLARRFHPDMAGPDSAIEMKRINRAYAVLSDPEKRHSYDTVIGGVIDLRKQGFMRPRPHAQRTDEAQDYEFSGLNIFSTRGPFQGGPLIQHAPGVISALNGLRLVHGLLVAAGTIDGNGTVWQIANNRVTTISTFAADPALTVESLRELRFSDAGSLLAGWGRLGLHIWDTYNGSLLWSHGLQQRAVSNHYSLDLALDSRAGSKHAVHMALPYLPEDIHSPRALGVRATDVLSHELDAPASVLSLPITCAEDGKEHRQFRAIRLRALTRDANALVTFSCAQVPQEEAQMAMVRRWDLNARGRLGGKKAPAIPRSILVGRCEDCTPPYAITPDASMLAFVYQGNKIRLCDTITGIYSEIASGQMGGNARLAISPDAQWLAVAREDSEVNEGVIDLWSIRTGQIVQKFYHPWQIGALHFTDGPLIVGLTDATIQVWQ